MTIESPVATRRAAKIASIIASAWDLARERGIAGISLRELAGRVGMRQPSLYEYFASKDALYDEMFAEGNRQLLERIAALSSRREPRAALKAWCGMLVSFCLEEPARYELLFQRHVPGFEPSTESYALAGEALGSIVARLHAVGVTDQGDIDCIVAVVGGLVEAQLTNDPGGTRWTRHLNHLVDILVDDALKRSP